MPNESKVFDLTISSEKNDLQYIPAIIPEAYQEWAKDVELKGSSTILFTMKGVMNSMTNQNPDIHIDAKIDVIDEEDSEDCEDKIKIKNEENKKEENGKF